jgi:Flp pilus assembly protein TadD
MPATPAGNGDSNARPRAVPRGPANGQGGALPTPSSEEVPVAEAVSSRYEVAAKVLDRAVQAGCKDPNVLYLLAMAHKRQGQTGEARAVLRKIEPADANVTLQMGLLSLQEKNLLQAEGEFARAWGMDRQSYEACYNLLLTQLTLGKIEDAFELLPRARELARSAEQHAHSIRFLELLEALLGVCRGEGGTPAGEWAADRPLSPLLSEISSQEENALLQLVRGLGQLDVTYTLLSALTEARPQSIPVREAYVEAALLKARQLAARCMWPDAERVLRPLARGGNQGRSFQVAILNLLGCCSAMTQDFDAAVTQFHAASKLAPSDPWIQQNLALTYELQGDLTQADPHWNRYFDLLGDMRSHVADIPAYMETLAYEALNRLAASYTDKERWDSALAYVQRAARLRPNDGDTLERLFHLYNSAKRPRDARRTLDQLRRLRPGDPQLELYELDMIEVRGLNDIEKLLTEIDKILRRHPGDARVEERAVGMVGNVIPLMGNLCDQLTDQMSKVIDQVRHLPNYQINWSAVREVMRDLLREFQKLRRITGKCLPLVTSDEHKRIIRDLADHIDRKMEACRSMGT